MPYSKTIQKRQRPSSARPRKRRARVAASGAAEDMARTGSRLNLCMFLLALLNGGLVVIFGVLAALAGGAASWLIALYMIAPVYAAAVWFFLGRYFREMGRATRELDGMTRELQAAQRGDPVRRRRRPATDRLTAAGDILHILMWVSVAAFMLSALAGVVMLRFAPVPSLALVVVCLLNSVLPYLYGAFARASARAIAGVSHSLFVALTRQERVEPAAPSTLQRA